MNKHEAKAIAGVVTEAHLAAMFERAKTGVTDWTAVSYVNPCLSKGAAWNILYKAYLQAETLHVLAKTNMIREFGEFIRDEYPANPPHKHPAVTVHHEDPEF